MLTQPVIGQPTARDWGRNFNEVTGYLQASDGSLYYVASSSGYEPGSGAIHRITHRAAALGAPLPLARLGRLSLIAQPSIAVMGSVHFSFALATDEFAMIRVFDIAGRVVASLTLPPGQRSGIVPLGDAHALTPGVYRAALSQGLNRVTTQLVIPR